MLMIMDNMLQEIPGQARNEGAGPDLQEIAGQARDD